MSRTHIRKKIYILAIMLLVLLSGCQKVNEESQDFQRIKKDQIDRVEVSALNVKKSYLSDDEITTLVSFLNKSENVQEYKGPTPKGGPLSFNMFLKSKEEFTLYSSKDGFLLFLKDKRYDVKQKDYKKFATSIYSKYRDK